jgi:hypothetical protein
MKLQLCLAALALACGSLLAARPALARDLFVDNVAGDDLFDGGAARNVGHGIGPVRTLAKALRLAEASDRIVLANTGQPYHESVSLVGSRHSGTPRRPFVIQGNGAVLDGSRPVDRHRWEHVADDVYRFRPERLHFQQLFVHGRPAVRRPLDQFSWRRPELEVGEWLLDGRHLYFRTESGQIPDAHQPRYAAFTVGLTLYKVEHVVIEDLVVQGFQLDGINVHDSRGPCILVGLTCRGNGRSGIAVCGASQAVIEACLIGDNGQCQVWLEGPSETLIENCEVLPESGPRWLIDGARLTVDGQPITEVQP